MRSYADNIYFEEWDEYFKQLSSFWLKTLPFLAFGEVYVSKKFSKSQTYIINELFNLSMLYCVSRLYECCFAGRDSDPTNQKVILRKLLKKSVTYNWQKEFEKRFINEFEVHKEKLRKYRDLFSHNLTPTMVKLTSADEYAYNDVIDICKKFSSFLNELGSITGNILNLEKDYSFHLGDSEKFISFAESPQNLSP